MLVMGFLAVNPAQVLSTLTWAQVINKRDWAPFSPPSFNLQVYFNLEQFIDML